MSKTKNCDSKNGFSNVVSTENWKFDRKPDYEKTIDQTIKNYQKFMAILYHSRCQKMLEYAKTKLNVLPADQRELAEEFIKKSLEQIPNYKKEESKPTNASKKRKKQIA